MEINSKELVNGVMDALNEDGAFDSPFLSKGKFKLILSKNLIYTFKSSSNVQG